MPYGYSSLYTTWLCSERTGQASLAGETRNWACVRVNSLASVLHDHGELEVDGRRVQELARRIGDLRASDAWHTTFERRFPSDRLRAMLDR